MPAIYVPEGTDSVANTTTDDAQNRPDVTWLEDGLHYVVVWASLEEPESFEIRGRVFNADGTPADVDFLVATGPSSQSDVHIAPLLGGGFLVVWNDSTAGTAGIWGRIYDSTLTGGALIPLKSGIPITVYQPSVSTFADGSFVVSWTEDDGADTNIHAQVFTALGIPSGPEVTANTDLTDGQVESAVAALANGNYVVVWQDGNEGDSSGIRMAIYTPAGLLVPGSDQLVNTTTLSTQEIPTVTALAGGGFVVAWVDYSLTGGDATGSDIRAQIFDSAGATVGLELLVNGTAPGAQTEARIAALADGSFVVSWTSANGTDDDIRAQRFDAGGTKLGAETLVPSDPDGNQAESAVAVSPANGDLVVTWTDYGTLAVPSPGDIEQRLFDLHSFPSVDLNGPGTGGLDYSTAYTEDGAAAAVAAAALEITQDSEHPILTITITITDAVAGDQLTLAGGLPAGITSSAPGGTTLTLINSGASADDLELALLLVRYSTTSDNPTIGAGNGDRIISILANDGPLSSDPAFATIAVTAANDPAIITGTDTGSVTEDATLTATGTLVATDPDTGQNSFDAQTGLAGTYGTLDIDGAGEWTYTLSNAAAIVQALGASSHPTDTITVHSIDGTAHDIVVTVNGANDAPVANDDTLAATEDVPVTYAAADLTTNDTDAELDTLSVASVSNATGGTAVRNGNGTVTFTPDLDFNGTAGFDYVVSDGNGGTDTGHATVNVAAVNDAPVVTFAATTMGGETRVNSFVGNPQQDAAVAALTGGGHVVVWASIQDGSGYGVYAQRYDASGAPLGSETPVNTETVANQFEPDVAALADGSYVVVWSGNGPGDPVGVFMQIYNAAGVAQGGETLVNSVNAFHQSFPSVTALAGGGYVIVWQSEGQDGSGAGIFGQRFNASGVAQDAEFPINTVTGGVQQYPSVTGLAGGGFAVTWFSDHEGSGQGVYVRQFDALGVGQGNEVRANTFTADDQSYSSIGALADGGYVVAWASLNQDGSHYSVYAQRYSAAGAPVGVEFRVNTTLPNQQEVPTIAGLADGGFVITWRSFDQDGSDYGVYSQRYNAAGATVGVETRINTTTSGAQLNPDVAALPGSGYVVAWHGNGVGDSDGVFTQLQSTAFFATEQVALDLKGTMSVADVDAGALDVTISLLVSYGVLHVEVGTSGATIDAGNDSAAVTVTGTVAEINALLGSDATSVVRFTANTDNPPATATLTLAVNDNGHTGAPPLALTDTESATINIAAVNDPAVLSADTRNLTETNLAADISSSGTLTISDVDSPETFVAQGGTVGSYGTFAINAAGAWTYTASSAHNEFAAGVTYTDTFSVSSADGTTTSVTINILGTNDAAVLSADVRNLTETNLAADISSSGTLTISDVDSSATFVAQGGTAGTYGTFAIDSAGAWTYTASSAHNEFVAGVTYTDTFPVSSADGTATSVTINILGTNDAAILSADVRDLTETNLAADISSSGTLTISDVDSSATFVAQGGTAGTYGTFAINAAGAWTYTASSAHNEFVQGVTYTDTFPVSSADGTTTSVTINILGTNDAAILSADVRDLTETNLAADISSSGTLTVSDVDSPETFVAQGGTVGTYGTFAIDTAGAWTYTASSAHNEFAAGVTYTDTFSVAAADGTATSVTINILGTNDAAILSADVRDLTETNLAADISSSGTLTISDVDSPETFVAQGGTVGTYGTFAINAAGAWTYTASSAHNEFAAGVTYTDTFSVASADGTLTSVTINILGTNDAAVLSADVRNLTETNLAADISSSGTLTISDVDSSATFVAQGGTIGTYGTFAIDSAGAWTYTASSAHNEFVGGVTYTDTFPVSSADGTTTSVTINILGTNDAAILSADVRDLTETNLAADISSSGTLTVSDVDSSATFVAQGGTVGTYGTFAIDTAGAWTYTASSAHNEFAAGVTYTDTFPVSSADGTLTSVTINILGTNDAAILSADTRNLTETNLAADISSSGALTISDVDSPATFVAQGGTVGSHGTFAINTAGAWTYTASSAHDEFAAGVTYTDIFSVASADGTLTSVTINILGANDAPEGVDFSLTVDEDAPYVFAAADFAYSDAENDDFFSVTIATLPAVGTGIIYYDADGAGVTFSPVAISAGQTFTAADLANGWLSYVPPTNVNGVGSASFTYQVRDDAGTDNGGTDFDASANTITIDLTAINDAPTVAIAPPGTTDEHIALSLKGAISVGDVDSASDVIQVAVSVGYGILTADPTGSGASVSGTGTSALLITGTLAQVQAFLGSGGPSTLTYTPNTDNPPASTTLTVTVDDGGHNGLGGTLTASANQTINIVQINDAPSGFDHAITASENTPRALNPVDFAFTDPEGHGFAAVTIVTLPTQGTLMYDADGPGGPGAPVAVVAGTTFTAAQLVGAKLVYRADPDESGLGYATFTYIVRDNGGTDHGGLDTDPGANTITINVNAFNNGPTVTDLDNDSPTFFEDTLAGVVWLDEGRDAVISDLDNTDFDGGSLTVRIVVNKVATEDELVLITGTNGVTLTAGEVFVDGVSIGTYSGGGLGQDLTFTLNAGATPASITRLIHNLSYLNTDTVEPNTGQRLVEFRLTDGDGGSLSAYTTINVVSVDDPATAGADAATTNEATPVVIAVLTNDDDIDGPPPSVAAVNGNPISVGTPITLPSGALLTLNADGTFTYDPNHAFDTTPTGGSGASNTPETDEFSYTLAVAGGTANVSVTITGLDTDDFLFGTAGADSLSGGTGNDFYFVEQALDAVVEAPGQGFDVVWTTVSYILAAGTDVEVLSARFWEGTDALGLTGNEIANTLYGNAGANALDGGGGSDTLIGMGGNDALTGGLGVDTMYGGSGDDFYFVDNAADAVIETAGQGYDVVWASVSYILATGTDVEALSARFWEGIDALSLTGNGLANTIYGNAGANALDGSGGNDTLFGFGGNDALTGGAGADLMYGGAGDDFYYVDNAGDVAVENASEGFDAVWTSVNYTLGAGTQVEVLSARFWEGIDPLSLTGNELANTVYGNAGANALNGGGGDDTLFGFGGNDSLTGGTGADTMYGGAGDDFYFVDNALDRPIETAGQGYDVIWSLVSYILAGGTQIEALSAASWEATTALNLTGNELANVIYGNAGVNILDGADGNDTLFGMEGNDTLFGGGGADLIYGGAGADSMQGGAGADVMVGGAGDDFYFVENALDAAAEAGGEGYDVVWASVSYTLAADTEVETLSTISWEATTAINLTGNGSDNTLYGNAGANILNGGGGNDTLFGLGGNDTLIGGGGADNFLFNTALGAGNIDTIADFSAPDDTIVLDHFRFVGLGEGPIEEGNFTIGTSANDDDDRIIYDPTTGALYYDADGGGGESAVQFATLQGAPAITFGDFTVI